MKTAQMIYAAYELTSFYLTGKFGKTQKDKSLHV